MYLTRAFLDPTSHAVRADLQSPESLHKTVQLAFPDPGSSPRSTHTVLHRLEHDRWARLILLIQSRTRPLVDRWPADYALNIGGDLDRAFSNGGENVGENPAIRDVEAERAALSVGRRLLFRLRANTTRKVDTKTTTDGVRRGGRRVPVRGDTARMQWLARHAETSGFSFDAGSLRISEIAAAGGTGGKQVTVAGALFEGVLLVRDVVRFRQTLESGIGPAKAYGFGLLSIAPAR